MGASLIIVIFKSSVPHISYSLRADHDILLNAAFFGNTPVEFSGVSVIRVRTSKSCIFFELKSWFFILENKSTSYSKLNNA